MIQIYSPGNNAFAKNGNAVLQPIDCQVTASLNGSWTLELNAPIDDENRWKLIEVGAVIKAPSFNGDQLFRIRQTEKKDSGIKLVAEPIFMDAVGDCFLMDVRPTNKTGQEALDMILEPNNKYSGTSDIQTVATAYFVRKNALEAIAGSENSFLMRWGGEVLYNNYQIIINERVGGDYGATLLYGKNIPVDGMSEAVNMDGVVTRIIPKAYNGYMLAGSTPWRNSPIINAYPTVMTKVIDYENIRLASDVEGDDTEGLIICNTLAELRTALRDAADEEFVNGIDKPAVSISADMVMLANTVEYSDYKDLEEVSLGDTIHCKHSRLGIVTDARVIGLTYDCIAKAVTKVTIGEHTASFLDRVASTVSRAEKAIKPGGTVRAEQVQGLIDGIYTQLRIQNTVARRQDARAILFEDLDPASPTYGALAIGTQGWQISKTRTADDRDWVWSTAATASGIVADAITAGTLQAIDITGVNITGSTITGSTLTNVKSDGTEGVNISGGRIRFLYQGVDYGEIWVIGDPDSTRRGILMDGASVINLDKVLTVYDEGIVRFGSSDPSILNSLTYYADSGRLISSDGTNISRMAPTYLSVSAGTNIGSMTPTYLSVSDGTNTSGMTPTYLSVSDGTYPATLYPTRLNFYDGEYSTNYQKDQIRLSRNGELVWGTVYKAGDSITTGVEIFAGQVSKESNRVSFFIPLNISAAGRTVTTAVPSDCSIITGEGYLNGSSTFPATGITIATFPGRNGVFVQFTSSTPFTNLTKSQVANVRGNFTLSFS